MVKKTDNNKKYKNMSYAQKKTNYSKPKTSTKSATKTTKKTSKKSLEATTRIRIDNDRLNDIESLDTSFLEGRITSKKTNKIISNDVKLSSKDTRKRNTRRSLGKSNKIDKTLVFSVFIIVVIGVLITFAVFSIVNLITGNIKTKTVVKTEVVTKKVVKNVMDENIVFLGDSLTSMYDVDKFYDAHNVINSGVSGESTNEVMTSLKDRVFIYNPSKVFLLIGTNDFDEENHGTYDEEKTVDNIKSIIEDIKENRKFAEIYVESIYPINNGDDPKIKHFMVGKRTNEDILSLNKKIKSLAKKEKVNYINVYDKLLDEEGSLNLDYTTDGLHINDTGYDVITGIINNYL